MPAVQILARDLNWNGGYVFTIQFSGVARLVNPQLTARDRIRNARTSGPAVAKEISRSQRFVLGLVMHVLPATGRGQHCSKSNHAENCPMREQRSPHCLPD